MASAGDAPSAAPRVVIDVPSWVEQATRSRQAYGTDDEKMALVISLARENVDRRTGGPFGAAVFETASGRLVAAGVNSVTRLQNCVLHAEVVAIMLAQHRVRSFTLGPPALPAHELITSCEPCAMCLGGTLYSGMGAQAAATAGDDGMDVGCEEGPVFSDAN